MMPAQDQEKLPPPCTAACPVGTDARRYVGLIYQGRYEEALEAIKANNVIPSICAYICAHPCEDACRRQYIEGPLAIRALKRFVMDHTREYRRRGYRRAPLTRPQKVAIVGSGPAGLAAARDLLHQGYPVTLFERESEPGGMPMQAIPKFRLPRAVVWEDLHELEALGAQFRTGQAWGRDFSLLDLKEQGYQAVLLAIGLQKGRRLPIPGMDAAEVYLALPFLRQVYQGQTPPLGRRVLIVGCGNVAMDTARTLKRLNVPEVVMICLEGPSQLFASAAECERTQEEVVDLIYQWAPKVVQVEGGRVQGIELMSCPSLFDAAGRFAPTFDGTKTQRLAADTLIFAIGQEPELEAARLEHLVMKGRLQADRQTMATSFPNVFAGGLFVAGEILTGPTLAVGAAASGRRSAAAIDHWLRTGQHLTGPEDCPRPISRLPEEQASRICRVSGRPLKERPVAERLKDFDSAELVYEEPEALIEARRCLHCGRGAEVIDRKCIRCLTCVRSCPFKVPHMENMAVFPETTCIACGFCASQCPAYAINIWRLEPTELRLRLGEILLKGPREITFACLRGIDSRGELQAPDTVWWDCLKLLQMEDLLAPFELKATGLILKECQKDCRLEAASSWLQRLVQQANGTLATVGLVARIHFAPKANGEGGGKDPVKFQEISEH
jgi:NADPH-dependent glutamate synthase beta subunit-like oxidoreductase/ferredoxin